MIAARTLTRSAGTALRGRLLRTMLLLCALSLLCDTRLSAQPAVDGPAPAAGLVEWQALGTKGAAIMPLVGDRDKPEWFAFRVRYPAGMETDSAPHFHFGTEHITVLSGTLVLGFGDCIDPTKTREYGPGSFVVIVAGVHHFEWFRGETVSHVEGVGPMRTIRISRTDSTEANCPKRPGKVPRQ